jgi:hypothetical protein
LQQRERGRIVIDDHESGRVRIAYGKYGCRDARLPWRCSAP